MPRRFFLRAALPALLLVALLPAAGAADLPVPPTNNLYVPTSASIHGAAGAFFHTDLWVSNRSYTTPLSITATYYCFTGPCGSTPIANIALGPRETKLLADVVGTTFGRPETAGSIALSYASATEDLTATTRTYTPNLPSPTNGTAIPALKASDAKVRALFLGLGNNGGNLAAGFRSNAGVFNPWNYTAHVTFSVVSSLGPVVASVSRDVPAQSATQISDIFGAAGLGATVTTNATLVVTASAPVFHFVTVIDNQSGDSVFVPPADDPAAEPTASLLVNGSFDSNVGSWSAVTAALAWSQTDARGNPASGSAVVTNTSPGAAYGGNWIQQCVAVQPGNVLTLSGRSYVSSNQATTGIVQLEAYFSTSANCASQDVAGGGIVSQSGDDAFRSDQWILMQAVGTVPASAHSASIEVQVTKREAGGTFVAYVDEVSVISSPPIPR